MAGDFNVKKETFYLYIGEKRETEENMGPLFNKMEWLATQNTERADLP